MFDRLAKKKPERRPADVVKDCKYVVGKLIESGYTFWSYEKDYRIGMNRCPVCYTPGQCAGSTVLYFIWEEEQKKYRVWSDCGDCTAEEILDALGLDRKRFYID